MIDLVIRGGDLSVAPTDATPDLEPAGPNLSISTETVCFIIAKARDYDGKDVLTDPDSGSNPTDDNETAILEEHEDDVVGEELVSVISDLSVDAQIDLVTLMWLGREDHTAEDWDELHREAANAHNARTASYLMGTPLLADFLAEGLSILGLSCAETDGERP